MKALMFANGEINDYSFIADYLAHKNKHDLHDNNVIVFSVDGGLRHADAAGIKPDYIIGDFDSAAPGLLEKYKRSGASFVKFPAEKDFTDLEAAVKLAIEYGVIDIVIFGALGGRIDHELANINLLYLALKSGVDARIVDASRSIRLTDSEICIEGRIGDIVSLIPFGGMAAGIITQGLAYPLKGEALAIGESRGVSNIIIEEKVSVTLSSGMLLVIEEKLRQ